MCFINLVSIIGVGYLIGLHIYLQSQGLTTYEYVKKLNQETSNDPKKMCNESEERVKGMTKEDGAPEIYNIRIARKQKGRIRNIDSIIPGNFHSPKKREGYTLEEDEKNSSTNTKYSPSRLNNLEDDSLGFQLFQANNIILSHPKRLSPKRNINNKTNESLH